MRRFTIITLGLIFFLASCQSKQETPGKTKIESTGTTTDTIDIERWGEYKKIDPKKIPDNAIALFCDQWMLITAGKIDSCNTMTASWGTLGHLWQKQIATCFIKKSRYTHAFIEKEQYYTLSFFPEEYRATLKLLGSKSGRDGNKIKEAKLTCISTPTGSTSFSEARMIIECKKIYAEPLRKEYFVDKEIFKNTYAEDEKNIHTMYIGEIVNVWVK